MFPCIAAARLSNIGSISIHEGDEMKIDTTCRYRSTHEYARKDGNEIVIGISDHAQASLGDIVFVEVLEVGKEIKKGEAFGVVESVKAASDLYAPMSGTITAVNTELQGNPALVNKDCYGSGWIARIAPSAISEWDELLDAAAYEKEVSGG
jgi:glycine cleavage system H protein